MCFYKKSKGFGYLFYILMEMMLYNLYFDGDDVEFFLIF